MDQVDHSTSNGGASVPPGKRKYRKRYSGRKSKDKGKVIESEEKIVLPASVPTRVLDTPKSNDEQDGQSKSNEIASVPETDLSNTSNERVHNSIPPPTAVPLHPTHIPPPQLPLLVLGAPPQSLPNLPPTHLPPPLLTPVSPNQLPVITSHPVVSNACLSNEEESPIDKQKESTPPPPPPTCDNSKSNVECESIAAVSSPSVDNDNEKAAEPAVRISQKASSEEPAEKPAKILWEKSNENDVKAVVVQSPTFADKPKSTSLIKLTEGEPSADGKLQYGREFLLGLQRNQLSLKRPESLPDLEVVLGEPHRIQPTGELKIKMMNQPNSMFQPAYIRNKGGPQPFMPMLNKNSMGGGRSTSRGKPQRVIDVQWSGNVEAKLRLSENAWKPEHKDAAKAKDGKEMTKNSAFIIKKMRGILNKLTPENFGRLVERVKELDISQFHHMEEIINLIFEKAVDEQGFSAMYAQLCEVLSQMTVMQSKDPNDKEGKKESIKFKNLIIVRCQREFESDTCNKKINELKKEMEESKTPVESKELKARYDAEESKLRKRSVGNVRFIGELYKLKMLTSPIMLKIMKILLEKKNLESLECLCKLLTTVGKDLEQSAHSHSVNHGKYPKGGSSPREEFEIYFENIHKLVNNDHTNSRVKFLMMDVLELRSNDWVPRREDAKPKTKAQVHEDIRKEEIQQVMNLNNAPPPKNDRDRRRDGGRGGGGGRDNRGPPMGGMQDGGWSTVQSTRRMFDSSRLTTIGRNIVADSHSFRSPTLSWGMGASGGRSNAPNAPVQDGRMDEGPVNRFSVLEQQNLDNRFGQKFGPDSGNTIPRLAPGGGNRGSGMSFGSRSQGPPSGKEDLLSAVKHFVLPDNRSKSTSRSTSRDSSLVREAPAAQVQEVPISEDDAMKFATLIAEEYGANPDIKESKLCLGERFTPSNRPLFISNVVEWVLEKDAKKRKSLGLLLHGLLKEKALTYAQFLEGLGTVLELAEDFAIDVPQVCQYLGEVIGPLLMDSALSVVQLKDICQCANSKKDEIFAQSLRAAGKAMDSSNVADAWIASGLQWSTLLPGDQNVEEYVKKYEIEFTLASGTPVATPAAAPSDNEAIQAQLVELFKASTTNEHLFSWVEKNVADTHSKNFVRALVTALIESLLTISPDGRTAAIDNQYEEKLGAKGFMVKKYVDTNEDLELQCVYALQRIATQYSHPPHLLEKSFQVFYDKDIVSEDAFFKWQTTNDTEEPLGKGVSINSVKNFFRWLRDAEAEDKDQQT